MSFHLQLGTVGNWAGALASAGSIGYLVAVRLRDGKAERERQARLVRFHGNFDMRDEHVFRSPNGGPALHPLYMWVVNQSAEPLIGLYFAEVPKEGPVTSYHATSFVGAGESRTYRIYRPWGETIGVDAELVFLDVRNRGWRMLRSDPEPRELKGEELEAYRRKILDPTTLQ